MWATTQEIAAFIRDFEACTLPKSRWTHHAHLVVALVYLQRHGINGALDMTRQRIRAYNEAVGTPNTDTSGYHETLTRLFLLGVSMRCARHPEATPPELVADLLDSPVGDKNWPLKFYSKTRLFSVEARRGWIEPDLTR